MQEALATVNKQLASELATSQNKCVQQESELALKDTQLEVMKQKLHQFKPIMSIDVYNERIPR